MSTIDNLTIDELNVNNLTINKFFGNITINEVVAEGWDVANASYSGKSLDVSNLATPTAFAMARDGASLLVAEFAGDIHQFVLGTAFDISTAEFAGKIFDATAHQTQIRGLTWNNDGSKFHVLGSNPDRLTTYSCSINYDIASVVTFVSDVAVAGGTPSGGNWTEDGMLFTLTEETTNKVWAYDAILPFDISTIPSHSSVILTAEETSPSDFVFSDDGTHAFLLGKQVDDVTPYVAGTAFDITTLTAGTPFSVATEETAPRNLAFNKGGTKMYILGNGSSEVLEYDVPAFAT